MNIKKVRINENKIKDGFIFDELKGRVFDIDVIDDDINFNPFSDDTYDVDGYLIDGDKLIFSGDIYSTKKVMVEDRFNLDEITDFLLNMTDGKALIEEFKNIIINKCNDIESNKLFSEYEKQVLFGFKKYFEKLIITIDNYSEGEDDFVGLEVEKAFENERKREFMEMCGGEDWDYDGL